VYCLHDVQYSPGCVARLFAGEPERVLGHHIRSTTSWLNFEPTAPASPSRLLMAIGGPTVWSFPLSLSPYFRSPQEPTQVFATLTGAPPERWLVLAVVTSMSTRCHLKTGGATTMLKTGGARERPLPKTVGAGVDVLDALSLPGCLEHLRLSTLLLSLLPALGLKRNLHLRPRLP
jgi:hypothetical protein